MNPGKSSLMKGLRFGSISGILGAITALVRNDEFHVAAPTQRPISLQSCNGGQIVGFLAETVFVEMSNRRIDDWRRIEVIERWSTRFVQSRRLVFKECLIRSHLSRLRRKIRPFEIAAGSASRSS